MRSLKTWECGYDEIRKRKRRRNTKEKEKTNSWRRKRGTTVKLKWINAKRGVSDEGKGEKLKGKTKGKERRV